MIKVLLIGGCADGQRKLFIGAKHIMAAAEPKQLVEVVGFAEPQVLRDGYRLVEFDHKGWPAMIYLEDTLRVEDIHDLTENILP
jgi:hypothetical protein